MLKKFMSILRRNSFFFLDYLQGGIVKKSYKRIKYLDTLSNNSKELRVHQHLALEKLLKHSVDTVNFFSHIKGKKLSDFPVTNKALIRDHQDDFISNLYNKDNLGTMHTSGSTGTPFCAYQNKEKRKHVIAELLFYSEKAGYKLGDLMIHVRGESSHNQKSKLKQWINNHKIILINKYDNETIENIIKKINSSSQSTFLCYASTYDSLNDYFNRNGHSMVKKDKLKGLISNGQMLFDEVRTKMEEAFNCRCYSRYANEENGILGIDGIENNTFLLNEAHYIIEILKMDSDKPADEGTVGRIVLTDLYNHAMPFIRYDTGDVGSIKFIEYNGVLKRAITNFGGRKADLLFDSNGSVVYPQVITNQFNDFPEIKQFQIIQESKIQYTLKINTEENFAEHKELEKILKNHLGENTNIIVTNVEEIPILSSGKRRMIINQVR